MRISDWSSDVCSSDLMMLLILLVEFLHLILRQHLPCFWDNLFKLRPLRRGLVWITDVASTDVTEETEEIVLVGGLVSPIRRRLDDGRAGIDRVVYRTEELETFFLQDFQPRLSRFILQLPIRHNDEDTMIRIILCEIGRA